MSVVNRVVTDRSWDTLGRTLPNVEKYYILHDRTIKEREV